MDTLFQCPSIIKNPLLVIGVGLMGLQAPMTHALGYGIYDARALAMGGATVAIGDTSQAVYYNPALLSFHDGDEDKARDGRTYTPTLVAQASTAIESAMSAIDDNLDQDLTQSINAFNTQNSTTNAGLVAKSSRDLRKVLEKVANKDLTVDAFVGFSASQPGDHEGSAFYVGVRTIGIGTSKIANEDVALLDVYIDAMTQISEGVPPIVVAILHPNLISTNNQFVDPTSKLTSSADVSALVIGEWGLALSKEFTAWENPLLVGFTPKLMRVDAYRDSAHFNNTDLNSIDSEISQFADSKSSLTTFNADFGVATLLADHYRIGFAIKDIIAKNFSTEQTTEQNLTVKLRPRSRMGFGYTNDNLSVGLDYDIQKSTPVGMESPSKELSLGAEYKPFNALALRAGYRHNQAGKNANVASGGIGYNGKRFVADIAYSQGPDMKGASLQIGWTF